jgi:hypothetical protein
VTVRCGTAVHPRARDPLAVVGQLTDVVRHRIGVTAAHGSTVGFTFDGTTVLPVGNAVSWDR